MYNTTKVFVLLMLWTTATIAQNSSGVYNKLITATATDALQSYPVFGDDIQDVSSDPVFEEVLRAGITIDIDPDALAAILNDRPELLSFEIPVNADRVLILDLYRAEVMAGNFTVNSSTGERYDRTDFDILNYRGIVRGNDRSLVAINITPKEVSGYVSTNDGDRIIGKLEDSDRHIIYFEEELIPMSGINCLTADTDIMDHDQDRPGGGGQNRIQYDCVQLYIEIENEIVVDKGSVSDAVTYVVGLMNEVFTMYENENIPMAVEEIFAWSSTDPYSGSSGTRLAEFEDQLEMTGYDGDLAHLLGYGGGGGIARLDVLCDPNPAERRAYSGIFSFYNNVPTYSWSVYVITHEIGHNLGSQHTHACIWNGNNTAIDGCGPQAGYSEGCNGPIPTAGTIMSYCHLVDTVGIDFNLGFSTQPGDLIRGRVASANCLIGCYCPDLIARSLDSMDIDSNANTLFVSAVIENDGDSVMAGNTIQVQFYLADDANGSNPSLIGQKTENMNLSPGDTLVVGDVYALPAQTLNKPYISVVVDQLDFEVECSENNNTGVFQSQVVPFGCTDPGAHNYDPDAQYDDGNCQTCDDGLRNGDETDVDCGGVLCPDCTCDLAEWTVPDNSFPDAAEPTFESVNITASNISTVGIPLSSVTPGNPGVALGTYEVTDPSINLNKYVTFSIIPNTPGRVDLDTLWFDLLSFPDGPSDWAIRTSADNFAANVSAGGTSGSWTTKTVLLNGLSISPDTVEFRLYFWGATDASTFPFAYVIFDNINICGDYVTCSDGVQNGDETGIDCGGSWCDPCAVPCPDLVINWFNTLKLDGPDSIYGEIEVANIGNDSYTGTVDVDFYMSNDNILNTGSDTYLGSTTLNLGTLPAGNTFVKTDIYLDNAGQDFLIASVDEINQAVAECDEDNNGYFVDFNTCITTVTTTVDGPPGSLRWAAECVTPGGTININASLSGDTLVLKDIDPITTPGNVDIIASFGNQIYLAPHDQNDASNMVLEFNGATYFEGLRFIAAPGGHVLTGEIKPGGSVEFKDVEIQTIDLDKSP